MYHYSALVTYTGSNAFVLYVWPRLTRNGTVKMRFTGTPAEVGALRTAAQNAGFVFSDITRTPVPVHESVP